MGFSEMRGGMNMCRTVYSKMRITRCCGILVYEQTMKLRLGDWIYWSLTKNRNCKIIVVAITDNGRVQTKEDEQKNTKISRENSKDVKCKDNGDAHSGGSIGDNTAEVKRKSEDHRSRRIHSTDSKMCPLNVSKGPQERFGDVDQGAKVK